MSARAAECELDVGAAATVADWEATFGAPRLEQLRDALARLTG